jgi:hypothetical protein
MGAPARETSPIEQLSADLGASIAALPGGVELPARLFTLVAARLEIRKGALLLFDPLRLVFAPWASLGYDTTTLHRLRIPLGANDSFNALANGEPLVLADAAALAAYQPYFSSREFSSMNKAFLAPFIAGEKLAGVLIASDVRAPVAGDADVLAALRTIVRTGSARIDQARERIVAAAGTGAVRGPAALEEQVARFIGSRGTSASPAIFVALSVEHFARKVLEGHRHLDPFRLHEDLRHFIGSFVADTGVALAARQGLFVVGLRSIDPGDVDLFMHQLTLYLDGLFGSGRAGDDGPRIVKRRSWPSEGNDVRSLLDYLES